MAKKVRWTKIWAITFNQSENNFMTIHNDDKVCRVDLMRRKRKSDEPEGQLDLQVLSDPAVVVVVVVVVVVGVVVVVVACSSAYTFIVDKFSQINTWTILEYVTLYSGLPRIALDCPGRPRATPNYAGLLRTTSDWLGRPRATPNYVGLQRTTSDCTKLPRTVLTLP
ncbi:hypothetical protein ElyMa_002612400 [Elysia marginata]|uniref:Uncharacterized protein n=1 Tax=Elysia marginata TaxID=1093978 RepID=A0AAV4H629_9GAST|nr:hypothetical protein ElyMa_002612400 [Elysia marginata]